MKRKWMAWMLSAMVLCGCAGLAVAEAWDITNSLYEAGSVQTTAEEAEAGLPIFELTMADGSVIRGELYPEIAPQAVGNFIALANSGFYDGLTFHRVIPGFMIQGGCPNGDGSGGPGWVIRGEFAINGVENNLVHERGVLSMARRSQPMDSAGSQFFIVTTDSTYLDTEYAGFGRVTEGMEVADAIVETPRDSENKPQLDQVILSIRVETFGVEYPFEQM